MPKFSIIIPVYSASGPETLPADLQHYRTREVQRAIKSVIAQQYPDWELILVNDGCTDTTPEVMRRFAAADPRIKVIDQPNKNRAIARNRGMEEATGEWICWMDSDDEYSTHYLRELDIATQDFPGFKVFNFGSIIHFPDHQTRVRQVFTPASVGQGHEYFRSGHIGCGSFIFRRDLWLTKGIKTVRHEDEEGKVTLVEEEGQIYRIPDEEGPYMFAAASLFPWHLTPDLDEYKYYNTYEPENMFQDGIMRQGSSLGNPWGDDFLQFYLLTRDNWSQPLDVLLYIQYPRAHEGRYEHFGEIYEA